MSKKVRRLFEQFQPSHYSLDMTPDKKTMSFSGSVTIKGRKTGRPSQRITLHQKGLKITEALIVKHDKNGSTEIEVTRINKQNSLDEVRLHSESSLYPGKYTLRLSFEGKITDPMHGLYPCYFEHEGQKKMLLATQFESHHAREVFPCVDEPEAKATFDLALTTPKDEVVLANTPVSDQKSVGDNLTRTTFETTPIMSTYLLAFVIGEMHSVEAKTKEGTIIRTWATVAQPKDFLNYANDEGVKILEFFTNYFQTPFPLKKCDQVALPDFEAGAMENWGLIAYREIALLADPGNRSQSSEQYISMVVGHELSHQWFGNLVTMKWWDDLWLNESFASLMEHIALDHLHPDWFQWEQYTAADVIACSSRDIFKDVQPVHVDVKHPDEIATLFDPAIVYCKGGRLLKMMREYIGDAAFREGLQSYFKKHAYKNTVGDDLWVEMSEASGKDIKKFMGPWLSQSGMPILEVNREANRIKLSQKRFVLDKEKDDTIWPIPLLADQRLDKDLLETREAEISAPSEPVVFNQNGSGHMLVHYTDKGSRQYIAEKIGDQSLKPESRINILNDLLLLARKGEAPLTDSLEVIRHCSSEPREAVWPIMARTISTANSLTEGDKNTESHIKEFKRNLASDWYKKLGWDDHPKDSPNDKGLRQSILSITVASEDTDAVAEATKRYSSAKKIDDLPAEQRAMIVAAMVKKDPSLAENLVSQYKKSSNPDVQLAICLGLTNTESTEKGKYVIEEALGKKGFVRPQDIFRWYAYLMRNRYTRRLAWEWLKSDWNRLEKLFGDSKSFEYFIAYAAGPINTPDWQKEFTEFFTPKLDNIALKRNIKISLAEIEARVAWRQREEAGLREYFAERSK
jgi:aminopeptidase N